MSRRSRSGKASRARTRDRGVAIPSPIVEDEPPRIRVRVIRGNMQASFVATAEALLDEPLVLAEVGRDVLVEFYRLQTTPPDGARPTQPVSPDASYVLRLVDDGPAVDVATGLVHRERVYRLVDDDEPRWPGVRAEASS